jgi:hypothetical protein
MGKLLDERRRIHYQFRNVAPAPWECPSGGGWFPGSPAADSTPDRRPGRTGDHFQVGPTRHLRAHLQDRPDARVLLLRTHVSHNDESDTGRVPFVCLGQELCATGKPAPADSCPRPAGNHPPGSKGRFDVALRYAGRRHWRSHLASDLQGLSAGRRLEGDGRAVRQLDRRRRQHDRSEGNRRL